MIADAGRARLIDLGLATAPGPLEPELGTWSYMAPEQARGGRVDEAADVWGLGATLFNGATGFPPFNDPDLDDEADYPQLERRARPVAVAARGFRERGEPELGEATAALIDRCLSPEPADRPDLGEIAASLEEVAELKESERRLSRGLRQTEVTA